MAFGILRFDTSPDALEKARSYLEESIDYSSKRAGVVKAPHIFASALMDATNGRIMEAKLKMQQAADLDPQGHTFSADFANAPARVVIAREPHNKMRLFLPGVRLRAVLFLFSRNAPPWYRMKVFAS
jgi:hypothetical protein